MRRHSRLLGLALILATGCHTTAPTTGKARPAVASPKPTATPAVPTGPVPASEALRSIAQVGEPALLTGKVKLISDHGGGIISNNSGAILSNNSASIISDHGAGIISDHGAAIVANNGGGLTGKTKRTLLAAPDEALLADALVEVLDASGHLLAGPDGKPLVAKTDQQGNYKFEAVLPAENLVLRVRLYNGGQLYAMLAHDGGACGQRAQDLDTASSLGAAYVLDRYVKKSQAVFDLLPRSEAEALARDLTEARGLLAKPPAYQAADLAAATETLRGKAPAVDRTLTGIQAILLAGQADLGTGLPATQVGLTVPLGVTGDANGFYILERFGRVRRVGKDGRIAVQSAYAPCSRGVPTLGAPMDFVVTAAGDLLVADRGDSSVKRIGKDGGVTRVAGTGKPEAGPVGGPAASTALDEPSCLAATADGTLYVGEAPDKDEPHGRILKITPDGTLEEVPGPAWPAAQIRALAVAEDGTMYALSINAVSNGLWRRKAGTWENIAPDLRISYYSRLVLTGDGGVLVSEEDAHRIVRFAPDGKRTIVAGSGKRGYAPDGTAAAAADLNYPMGMWIAPDDALYFVDYGNSLVRRIPRWREPGAGAVLETVAGSRVASQDGDALNAAVNGPSGLALDPQGRLVVAEAGGNVIKRLDGRAVTVLAGSGSGFAGDGGPAVDAQLDAPTTVAYGGGDLYIVDSHNARIRKVDASGGITTVAGSGAYGQKDPKPKRRVPVAEAVVSRPLALAVAPDGQVYWSDTTFHCIFRLTRDGFVEAIAGDLAGQTGDSGDGGPAADAKLNLPLGLAFDSKGDLYVSDAGNLRIRKITGLAGPTPMIGPAVGAAVGGIAVLALTGAAPEEIEGKAVSAGSLLGPLALAFDAQDHLYFSELGTEELGALAGDAGAAQALIETALKNFPRTTPRIRRVGADGLVRTIAGMGTTVLAAPTGDDALSRPTGLVIDAKGRLVIADAGKNTLKLLLEGNF